MPKILNGLLEFACDLFITLDYITTTKRNLKDNSKENIKEKEYYSNIDLQKVKFSRVKNVGNEAFKGCISLTEIELPKVETIGKCAFLSCQSLKKIIITNENQRQKVINSIEFEKLISGKLQIVCNNEEN